MENLLQRRCQSILEAATREELQARLGAATEQLGFGIFCAMVVLDSPKGEPQFICVDNMSPDAEAIAADLSQAKIDPVLQHCKFNSTPIVWDQATYVRAGRADKWEVQAPLGFSSGICVAMHLPQGRHFVFGMDSDRPRPPSFGDTDDMGRVVSALLMLAVYAQGASMRLLAPAACEDSSRRLTPRELEVLRWTLEGKTAWEIGRILCIAENTVIRHAHSATHKLDGANKHHAAVKAWRAGLIG